jgi:hypothetical protein
VPQTSTPSDDANTVGLPFDVFLSHNGRDKPLVRELRTRLIEQGLRVWMDEFDLLPGSPWVDEIEKAIQSSRAIVVAIGNSGLGRWERPEMRCALIEMVRRGATVIPVLLPEAPLDVELPLFLQTLTWVDFRVGFDKVGLEKIKATLEHSQPREEPQPLPRYVPANPERRLNDFWSFATDLNSLSGWIFKSSAIAPVIPVMLGMSPPWDGTNRWTEAGTVILITAVTQFLALTCSYFVFPPMTAQRVRRMLLIFFVVAVVAMLGYLTAFVLLTEVQPNANTRLISGFSYSEEFLTVREETGEPIDEVKLGFGYSPLSIYKPWTVWCALLLLLFAWLTCFGAIALYAGLFVKHISSLNGESLRDNRPLRSFNWQQKVLQPLAQRKIETVADLCSMNNSELRKVFANDESALSEVHKFLRSTGLPAA